MGETGKLSRINVLSEIGEHWIEKYFHFSSNAQRTYYIGVGAEGQNAPLSAGL